MLAHTGLEDLDSTGGSVIVCLDPGLHSHDVFRVLIVDNFLSNGPSSSKIYHLVYLIVYETE